MCHFFIQTECCYDGFFQRVNVYDLNFTESCFPTGAIFSNLSLAIVGSLANQNMEFTLNWDVATPIISSFVESLSYWIT
jgi:hypothetical protein